MGLGELPPSGNYRGYYHLDTDGTDSSGRGNNLINISNFCTFDTGKFGGAVSTGTSGTSKGMTSSSTNIMSGVKPANCSVSLWMKFNSVANKASSVIWSIDTNGLATGSTFIFLYAITAGVLTVTAQQVLSTTAATVAYVFPSLPSTSDWINFVITKNASTTVQININGIRVATNTGAGTEVGLTTGSNRFILGNGRTAAQQTFATYDELIVEERVWSDSEIRKYYTQSKGRFQTVNG